MAESRREIEPRFGAIASAVVGEEEAQAVSHPLAAAAPVAGTPSDEGRRARQVEVARGAARRHLVSRLGRAADARWQSWAGPQAEPSALQEVAESEGPGAGPGALVAEVLEVLGRRAQRHHFRGGRVVR